jgi:hypothetical protein
VPEVTRYQYSAGCPWLQISCPRWHFLTTAIEASFSNRFGWYARAGAEWLVYCIVRFDDVIDALRELDGKPDSVEGIQRRRRDRRRGGDSEDGPTGRGNWF